MRRKLWKMKCQKLKYRKLMIFCFILIFFLSNAENNIQPTSSSYSYYSSSSLWSSIWPTSKNKSKNENNFKSVLRVDPSLILQKMIKYSGLVLPKNVEQDLKVMGKVCSCQSSYLDLINRELEIVNFTVALPDTNITSDPALKMSRVFLKWNSYLNPCIDIYIEDINVLIEFSNLFLTRNNWNDLSDIGFPPSTEFSEEDSLEGDTGTFVRIGSLNLVGNVTLQLLSKPLRRAVVPDVVVQFASLQELMDRIRINSDSHSQRKGSSMTEVYDIITNYTNAKIRTLLKTAFVDVAKKNLDPKATDNSDTVKEVRNLFNLAKNNVRSYAKMAFSHTDQKIQSQISDKLQNLGFETNEIERLLKASKSAASAAFSTWVANSSNHVYTSTSTVSAPLIAFTAKADDFVLDHQDNMEMPVSSNDGPMEWFQKAYHAASTAWVNVFIQEFADYDLEMTNDIQPDEIFFPPF